MRRMNRIVFYIALVFAFAWVQGLSLHGHVHQPLDYSHSATHGHGILQVHSHTVGIDAETAPEHSETAEVDLLGATLSARDIASPNLAFVLTATWALILVVLWVCIRRAPPSVPLLHFGSPPLLRPSPRAPPV